MKKFRDKYEIKESQKVEVSWIIGSFYSPKTVNMFENEI
jgi:hypothetical protein